MVIGASVGAVSCFLDVRLIIICSHLSNQFLVKNIRSAFSSIKVIAAQTIILAGAMVLPSVQKGKTLTVGRRMRAAFAAKGREKGREKGQKEKGQKESQKKGREKGWG